MSNHGVKRSKRSFDILRNHSSAVLCGMNLANRDSWLARARLIDKENRGMRLMYVDFAKDAHKAYMGELQAMKAFDERSDARRQLVLAECAAAKQEMIDTLKVVAKHTDEWNFVRDWT